MTELTPAKVLAELEPLARSIRRLEKASTYDIYGDCSGLETDCDSPDDAEIMHELNSIMEHLYLARQRIELLTSPVQYESRLYRNASGRYEDTHGNYYTCGSTIEFFVKGDPDDQESSRWVFSRVEHDADGYYIVGYRHLSLDRVLTRVRRR